MNELIDKLLSIFRQPKIKSNYRTTKSRPKCPLLRMGLIYPSTKASPYYIELYKMDFPTMKVEFNASTVYETLRYHPNLKNAQISLLNLNATKVHEFISFDKRKHIFGGDLLLPNNFYRSDQWQDLKNFAKENKMCIGYHALICDTTCLLIQCGKHELYLVDPQHIKPKAYLFKP